MASRSETARFEARADSVPAVRELPARSRVPLLLTLSAVCWVAALTITVLVATHFGPILRSDRALGTAIDHFGINTSLRYAALGWHYVGSPAAASVVAVVAVIVLFVTRHRGWAVYLATCAVGGVIIAEVVKDIVERPRPSYPDALVIETGGSFPSGHSMAGIYLYAVLGIVVMYTVHGWLGTIIGWCLVVFGVLMAPSRLLLGVHWPSDVIGGWMYALAWVLLVSAMGLVIVDRRARAAESLVVAGT